MSGNKEAKDAAKRNKEQRKQARAAGRGNPALRVKKNLKRMGNKKKNKEE